MPSRHSARPILIVTEHDDSFRAHLVGKTHRRCAAVHAPSNMSFFRFQAASLFVERNMINNAVAGIGGMPTNHLALERPPDFIQVNFHPVMVIRIQKICPRRKPKRRVYHNRICAPAHIVRILLAHARPGGHDYRSFTFPPTELDHFRTSRSARLGKHVSLLIGEQLMTGSFLRLAYWVFITSNCF